MSICSRTHGLQVIDCHVCISTNSQHVQICGVTVSLSTKGSDQTGFRQVQLAQSPSSACQVHVSRSLSRAQDPGPASHDLPHRRRRGNPWKAWAGDPPESHSSSAKGGYTSEHQLAHSVDVPRHLWNELSAFSRDALRPTGPRIQGETSRTVSINRPSGSTTSLAPVRTNSTTTPPPHTFGNQTSQVPLKTPLHKRLYMGPLQHSDEHRRSDCRPPCRTSVWKSETSIDGIARCQCASMVT